MNAPGLRRILLIEDDLGDAHLVRVALRTGPVPCALDHVKDGVEALGFLTRKPPAYVGAGRPDLIMLDINVPRMNGKEFLCRAKSDRDLSSIPIVVFTTSDVARDIAECYSLGANSFLTKPVDVDAFMAAIHSVQNYWFNIVSLPR